jgi:uncharacterized membrane protein AbrB (regulator of aidB expression)
MDTEKMIVVLLLLAILLSVVTLAITLSKDIVVNTQASVVSEDMGTASVILNIAKNPAKGDLG